MAVKPIPQGYHNVTPILVVQGASRELDFLKQAFSAQELHRMNGPNGRIVHAEVQIGDSRIMVSDACGKMGPMPTSLYLYVPDCDATYRRAVQAGATSLQEPTDMFWGDRTGNVKDPAGNHWCIGTHQEDLKPQEIARRGEAFAKEHAMAGAH
jgi:uncharacterized glyoxalase superfamily protein PhnB